MNFYLITKDSIDSRVVPLLWCSAKTYYEENGKKINDWTWADPWLGFDYSVDEILEICKSAPPDVFGCSVYLWNVDFMEELSRRVKDQYPQCLIVFGGPQVDIKYNDKFFAENPWVDVVCPSDGYGEITIASILDNYPIDDYNNIPYVYYTNDQKENLLSTTRIEKRSFQWPNNIFKAQEEILKTKDVSVTMYETARGCPYKCIYCDWGGGTYTKVSKKPYTTVLDELVWIAKHKIEFMGLTDANFGIMSIDVDIAEYIANLKANYGYPATLTFEPAKNHLDRVTKIYDLFFEQNMMYHYKISVQTTDDVVKNNIERIDIPLKDQVNALELLKAKHNNVAVKVETILGLPGSTYQTALEQIDLHVDYNLPISKSEVWSLLPEAPAYSPEMRERFKIKTIKKLLLSNLFILKKGAQPDPNIRYYVDTDTNRVECVVETYSYNVNEFIDMYLINALSSGATASGFNHLWIYLKQEHGIKASEVVDFVYKNFIVNYKNFKNPELSADFENLYETVFKIVHDETYTQGAIDYHPDFPLLLPSHTYVPFIIGINSENFYKEVCHALAEKFNDSKIVDLGKYLSGRLIDLTYNFEEGRIFKTTFNWDDYFKNNNPLVAGNYTYHMTDKDILINFKNTVEKPNWHTLSANSLEQKKQYYYQALTQMYVSRLGKILNLIW